MLEGLAGNKLKSLALSCLEAIRLSWHELEEKGTPADKFLSEFYRANHKYGSRDRHAITSSVFAFFRRKKVPNMETSHSAASFLPDRMTRCCTTRYPTVNTTRNRIIQP